MKTFADTQNREWTLSITVDAIRRVRATLGIDLLAFIEENLIQRFIADPVLLCDVIYLICKPDAERLNISDADFGRAMAGDAIEHATVALLEDLADFSPSPRIRAYLRKILQTMLEAMGKTIDAIGLKIEEIDVDAIVAQTLSDVSGSSGSVPASSGSIPDPSL